jgi:hypothetical protein
LRRNVLFAKRTSWRCVFEKAWSGRVSRHVSAHALVLTLGQEAAPVPQEISITPHPERVQIAGPEGEYTEDTESAASVTVPRVALTAEAAAQVIADEWESQQVPFPPFTTDGRGKVVFASTSAQDGGETGRERRRRHARQ